MIKRNEMNAPNITIQQFISKNAEILRPNQLKLIQSLMHNISEIDIVQAENFATITYKAIGITSTIQFEMLQLMTITHDFEDIIVWK